MPALQITISERHLASIAGVRVRLSGIRDCCWLSAAGRWPACHDSCHSRGTGGTVFFGQLFS